MIAQRHHLDGHFALLHEAVAARIAAAVIRGPFDAVARRRGHTGAIGAQPESLAHTRLALRLI